MVYYVGIISGRDKRKADGDDILRGDLLESIQLCKVVAAQYDNIVWREKYVMSDYIMDLRKIVGHRTLLQVGASVIVEDEQGRILLQKRSDNHCWAYAGGSVELDEAVEDTAKRELFEETGLIAHRLELLGVFSGKELHYVYPNGDEVSNVDIVYICKEYSGTLNRQEGEVDELKFFAVDEIPDNISPPNRIPLEQWRRKNSLYL